MLMMNLFFFFPPAQHYRPQMFMDNLTTTMQSAAAASTSAALVSSTSSHYDTSGHAASSIHETRVIAGGGGGAGGGTESSMSDIISLDWAASSGLFSRAFLAHIALHSVWSLRRTLCWSAIPVLVSWFQHLGNILFFFLFSPWFTPALFELAQYFLVF